MNLLRFCLLAGLLLFTACEGSDTPSREGDGVDGAVSRETYPSGPYGLVEGDTLEALSFVTPEGGTLSLGEVRADGQRTLLLLVTAAAWCSACIEEQQELESLYQEYAAQGLSVVVALFEDAEQGAATADLASTWKRRHELSFPVVADPEFQLSAYYDRTATPMNMLVDLDDMRIVRISTGFDGSAIRALVRSSL